MNSARIKQTPYLDTQASGKRLVLRPYKVSDFKSLRLSFERRLPAIDRFDKPIASTKEPDTKKFKERVQRYRRLGKEGHQFFFGAFDKKTGEFIGQIDLFVINNQLRWINLGYIIQNQYRNKGYATEVAKLGLRIAFKQLNFHHVEAAIELANKASQKVALNAGLVKEGKRIKFFPDNGGIDMIVFGQNRIDYK